MQIQIHTTFNYEGAFILFAVQNIFFCALYFQYFHSLCNIYISVFCILCTLEFKSDHMLRYCLLLSVCVDKIVEVFIAQLFAQLYDSSLAPSQPTCTSATAVAITVTVAAIATVTIKPAGTCRLMGLSALVATTCPTKRKKKKKNKFLQNRAPKKYIGLFFEMMKRFFYYCLSANIITVISCDDYF